MVIAVLLLLVAIACEVAATGLLKASDGFSRLWPTVGMGAGYIFALLLLSYVVQKLPVGPVYAVWAGLGTTGVTMIGIHFYHDKLPAPAWAGIALIIAGVAVLGYYTPDHGQEAHEQTSVSMEGIGSHETNIAA